MWTSLRGRSIREARNLPSESDLGPQYHIYSSSSVMGQHGDFTCFPWPGCSNSKQSRNICKMDYSHLVCIVDKPTICQISAIAKRCFPTLLHLHVHVDPPCAHLLVLGVPIRHGLCWGSHCQQHFVLAECSPYLTLCQVFE